MNIINHIEITDEARNFYPLDNEFKEATLKKVIDLKENGYEFDTDIGCILCPKHPTFVPKAGMKVRFFGKGFGYTVRGISINDNLFYYRTVEEAEADHKAWVENENKKKKEQYEKEKPKLEAAFKKLPKVFQTRIEQFRTNNPDFNWEYELYEMFCCTEALEIAEKLKSVEAIDNWKQMSWDGQRKIVKISDGHSGNTFGCSVALAKTYLTTPENVIALHGALCPLVGCKEYGCVPKDK